MKRGVGTRANFAPLVPPRVEDTDAQNTSPPPANTRHTRNTSVSLSHMHTQHRAGGKMYESFRRPAEPGIMAGWLLLYKLAQSWHEPVSILLLLNLLFHHRQSTTTATLRWMLLSLGVKLSQKVCLFDGSAARTALRLKSVNRKSVLRIGWIFSLLFFLYLFHDCLSYKLG